LEHASSAFLLGPGKVGLFLVLAILFVLVDHDELGVNFDFVNLQEVSYSSRGGVLPAWGEAQCRWSTYLENVPAGPGHSEGRSAEDDVVSIGALNDLIKVNECGFSRRSV
jgi:hypothetical protein